MEPSVLWHLLLDVPLNRTVPALTVPCRSFTIVDLLRRLDRTVTKEAVSESAILRRSALKNWWSIMRKRVIAFLLAGIMSFSTFATGVTTVQAAEKEAVVSVVQQLPMPKESDYANVPTERNFATKVVKDAIEFILKHGDEAAKIIEKISGKTVAKNFLKHFDKVSAALKPLLKWADIPAQAVYDAVYRALYNAGVSSSVAANIALAIKEGLSWFF